MKKMGPEVEKAEKKIAKLKEKYPEGKRPQEIERKIKLLERRI